MNRTCCLLFLEVFCVVKGHNACCVYRGGVYLKGKC